MSLAAPFGIFTGTNLRRVRRDEVARPAFDKPDPYGLLMACWADYTHVESHAARAAAKLGYGSWSKSNELSQSQINNGT
jgi:hypothetical protein